MTDKLGNAISTGRAALAYLLYGKIDFYFGDVEATWLGIIIFAFIGVFLIYCIIYFFYKGRETRIFVVRKRKNLYKTYHWKHGTGTEEHYVVYAKYPNSDKVHTLGCDGYTYRKLRANKGYNVTVKLMWITKVHREKLKSKKKR